MTPAEFKEYLYALGWSQAEFARRTGLAPMSVSRWITGEHPIPTWVNPYIGAILSLHNAAQAAGVSKNAKR